MTMKFKLKYRICIYAVFITVVVGSFVFVRQPVIHPVIPQPINFAAKTVDELRSLADAGEAEAQYRLGWKYEKGEGVAQDYKQAAEWYEKAARQDHPGAENQLGLLYKQGLGVTQDYAEAMKWYRKAAEKNLPAAIANIAGLYENGRGVDQDYKKAAQWYLRAAELGHKEAQNNLGVLYVKGIGVAKDYKQAAIWFEKSAEAGFTPAQNNIAGLYIDGSGVQKDLVKAGEWYQKASRSGLEVAHALIENADDICENDPKNNSAREEYCMIAAGAGYPQAQSSVGDYYHSGHYLKQDRFKAAEWYRKAAEQGVTAAQAMLVRMYSWGEGVQADPIEAYAWWIVIAQKGSEDPFVERLSVATKAPWPLVGKSLLQKMNDEEVKEAKAKASKYIEQQKTTTP